MLGDISDEEANELITLFSESVRGNFLSRDIVESQIFPVTHYIHVSTYILYDGDPSYQYSILKQVVDKVSPEEIAKRSKCLGSPLNHLAFYSLAMLYLHGRAQVIHDNITRKNKGESNIVIESESKKKELKFVLDFWKRLSPNYLNNGVLTTEDKKMQCLSNDYVNDLRDQMIPISENNKEIIKKMKQTIAQLTIFNFLFQAECRAGIFEHGPYYFEDNPEPLIFKEFQYLYSGDELFGVEISGFIPHKISKLAPVPNVIFGMTLKGMNKIEFNDFGTLFADPSDFTSNITSIGIWTKEPIHPKDIRYPNNLGTLRPLSIEILDELNVFAKNATKEMYVDFAKWSQLKKLMLGTNLYANSVPALCAGYAGIEKDFNWVWAMNYADDEPFNNDLIPSRDKIEFYIEKLGKSVGFTSILEKNDDE